MQPARPVIPISLQASPRSLGLQAPSQSLASVAGRLRSVDPGSESGEPPAASAAALKGRGTAWAIAHRFERDARQLVDDGWGSLAQQAVEESVAPGTTVVEEHARRILNGNDSPDIPFDLSINPYRGCEHGCIYCFARPTHSYLDLSPGLDFETRIIAKVNAAERLREALAHPSYEPQFLNIGSATDCYQPVERRLRITRGVLEVLCETRHAFSLVTKSCGVERDIDLIGEMGRAGLAAIYVSLTTLDAGLARILEPRAAAPHRRLRTVEALARAGVPVGVSVSPIIPFINEPELEHLLAQARDAGASSAFSTVLRLPWEVNPLFQQWLETHFPDRAARVMARVREMRAGRDNDARFGSRMTGSGLWAQLLRDRFRVATQRLGLNTQRCALDLTQFVRPCTPPGPGGRDRSTMNTASSMNTTNTANVTDTASTASTMGTARGLFEDDIAQAPAPGKRGARKRVPDVAQAALDAEQGSLF